jgi:hypothetical protein
VFLIVCGPEPSKRGSQGPILVVEKKNCCRENLTKCVKSLYHTFSNLSSSLPASTTTNMTITVSPVVVYVCETWSLTLVWEHKLRMYESGMLRYNNGTQVDEIA